jgi:N,N'-diacetyllegionaminate synthase
MKNINDLKLTSKCPLLIAEIGGNHEGDFEYAKRLTELAINTDVDFVKFQIYTASSIVAVNEDPDRHNHFKKFELTNSQHIELAKMVTESGKIYISSVWDLNAIDWIDPYMPVYKIGSGDLTAYPVIKKIAQIGKPIILSIGLSTEEEALDAIKYIQRINHIYKEKKNLAVLQCTSMYPINYADANLKIMSRMKKLTNLTVGYSDHTEGIVALKYAYAMGAEIMEFHFTDDKKNTTFRDHKISLNNEDIKELLKEIDLINKLKGLEIKKPEEIEINNGHHITFRRGVYPNRDIEVGEYITKENISVLRPNHGIDAREYESIIGKKSITNLKAFEKINKKWIIN